MGTELVFVDSTAEVESFLSWLGERRPVLALDLETTGLDIVRDHPRLFQLGDGETGWAFPYDDWRGVLRDVLQRYERPLVAHNAKFDVGLLEEDDLQVPRHLFHDTMTMCHLADSHGPKALKRAAARYVDPGAASGERELREAMRTTKWTWATVPTDFEPYWQYGALDTVLTARLAERLWPRIQPHREAYELELEVTWVLLDIERRGLRVDLAYCERTRSQLAGQLGDLEARWADLNLHSQQQVVDRLQREGVQLTKRTKNGNPALDEEVLLSLEHPLAGDVLDARKCRKEISTYFDAYLGLAVDDVLHCNINPLGAEKTGRMSISRPSFQNIPRTKRVRSAIIPREGHRLVLADYQAQETRLVAHFADERSMIAAFEAGEDIHTVVAAMVYGTTPEAVTFEQRRKAKQAGHARNYGAGPGKIALTAGVTVAEATAFVHSYDQKFPAIQDMNRRIVRVLRERAENGFGHLTTYGGRPLRVPLDKAYIGANYLIQGSGADILKRGMVNAARAGVGEYLVLPVHDETIWDVPESVLDEALAAIHECMELTDLKVPFPVETKVVNCWGEAYP